MIRVNGYQIAEDKILYVEPEHYAKRAELDGSISEVRAQRIVFMTGKELTLHAHDIDAFHDALREHDREDRKCLPIPF